MNQSQAVYRVFSPAPLTPDQQSLYVSLDSARGDSGVVHSLARRIRLSEKSVSQVLAGHKGSGKSTELMQLQLELQRPDAEDRYFVVLVKADEDIDRNDVDFPEVLIALVRQMAKQLREREGIKLKPGYFKDRWERIKKLLGSEVSFDEVTLEAGMLSIASTIKNSPDAREDIRKLLEPDTTNWLDAANDVIGDAIAKLIPKGYKGLVVLVDDLDKMVIRPKDDAGCSTTEYLFIHRAAQLTAFQCHTVYTLPLSLAYSHHEQAIASSFGNHVPVVPMVKLSTPPPDAKPHKAGVDKMRDMIRRRCQNANINPKDLFKAPRVETDLIKLSGGQPRQLMEYVQEAIVSSGLPIDAKAIARVRKEGERGYARMLRREHWPILEEIRKTGSYTRTEATEDVFRELIDSRAILQYVNDQEWYGLNPMVADLEPPRPLSEE
jgi:hypothetical protein